MKTKTDRGIRIAYRDECSGVVRLGVGLRVEKVTTWYHVKSISDDMGWLVGWNREDGHGAYTVTTDHQGKALRCDCPARCRCKHMAASEVLIARELI